MSDDSMVGAIDLVLVALGFLSRDAGIGDGAGVCSDTHVAAAEVFLSLVGDVAVMGLADSLGWLAIAEDRLAFAPFWAGTGVDSESAVSESAPLLASSRGDGRSYAGAGESSTAGEGDIISNDGCSIPSLFGVDWAVEDSESSSRGDSGGLVFRNSVGIGARRFPPPP
jgi:hypothetical protein